MNELAQISSRTLLEGGQGGSLPIPGDASLVVRILIHTSQSEWDLTTVRHRPPNRRHPPSSILHPRSSTLHPPSSILHPPSSILYPLPSILHRPDAAGSAFPVPRAPHSWPAPPGRYRRPRPRCARSPLYSPPTPLLPQARVTGATDGSGGETAARPVTRTLRSGASPLGAARGPTPVEGWFTAVKWVHHRQSGRRPGAGNRQTERRAILVTPRLGRRDD